MTIQEYRRIQAERAAIENLLDQLPASSVVERKGLEFRKKTVEDILGPDYSWRPRHGPWEATPEPDSVTDSGK